MNEKTLERLESICIYTLISIFVFLVGFLMATAVRFCFFKEDNSIHTETVIEDNHKYIIFYDADNKVQHIEYSPDCDCLTIEYD